MFKSTIVDNYIDILDEMNDKNMINDIIKTSISKRAIQYDSDDNENEEENKEENKEEEMKENINDHNYQGFIEELKKNSFVSSAIINNGFKETTNLILSNIPKIISLPSTFDSEKDVISISANSPAILTEHNVV